MALALCESCRRHVRTTDDACPFCKTVRMSTKAVAVAASAFALAACFSPAAKYGGPPVGSDNSTTLTVTEAGPPEVVSPAAKYGGPPQDIAPVATDTTPSPNMPDASPRITDGSDAGPGGRKFAPVALYGAPPRKKPTPPTSQ